MKLKMTIAEALEFADEWSRGMTFHEDSYGWRVVCMLLAEEVRRLAALEKAIMDAEPVAVVGSTFQLLWSRQDWSEGLKVGDFLYTLNGIKP